MTGGTQICGRIPGLPLCGAVYIVMTLDDICLQYYISAYKYHSAIIIFLYSAPCCEFILPRASIHVVAADSSQL